MPWMRIITNVLDFVTNFYYNTYVEKQKYKGEDDADSTAVL
jgi:hypothetical protein